jgi:hypothetical protein
MKEIFPFETLVDFQRDKLPYNPEDQDLIRHYNRDIIIMKPLLEILNATSSASQTHFMQVYLKQKMSIIKPIILFCG